VASTLKGHQRPNNTSLAKRNTKKQGQRIEQQIVEALRKVKQTSNEISKKHKAKRKAMYFILIEDINTIN
jgi:hypothetical protein